MSVVGGGGKKGTPSARAKARAFALQALYQAVVGHQNSHEAAQYTAGLAGFHKADAEHFEALVHGCLAQRDALDDALRPHLDRPIAEVSPIEHVVLWIGVFELTHLLEVPRRVVLNECIELAKSFGGTDGHRFINGVLHPLAQNLRPLETST
ncbi:MAG: transcription antitermination factor NusB [Burkholderiaceae bacterium]